MIAIDPLLARSFIGFIIWLRKLHPPGSLDDAHRILSVQAIDLVCRLYYDSNAAFTVVIYDIDKYIDNYSIDEYINGTIYWYN